MKKFIILFVLIILPLYKSIGQIKFEPGYFIENNGQKTECFIRNTDWIFNPREIEYRLSDEGDLKKASLETISEFEIYNFSKFVRAEVLIDRSSNELDELSVSSAPEWSQEILFLRVLIEGKATLYSYKERKIFVFFFKTGDASITQLIHKKFLMNSDKVVDNNQFRVQLSQYVHCDDNNSISTSQLNYTRKDLVNHFLRFNTCEGEEYIDYSSLGKKVRLNLKMSAGFNYSSLILYTEIQFSMFGGDAEFGPEINFTPGLDIELFLPFNSYKWAIFAAPSYQSFKSETSIIGGRGSGIDSQLAWANYTSIEIPVGLRHYFFLKNSSRIYLSGMVIFDYILDSTFDFEVSTLKINGESGFNIGLGIGYEYKRFNLGIQTSTKRNITINYYTIPSDFRFYSLILSYRLIK